jgi:signal transduction histidine kinase
MDACNILTKFAAVFSLTYRRYLDLKISEGRAREAVKQASLDRVRAEIASMRTTADLERITPLVWNELTTLGVPFIRCGVFIMDELKQLSHTYLSTPDGKAVAAFDLPYSSPGNIARIVQNWREKKIYTEFWNEEAYTSFGIALVQHGIFSSTEQYLNSLPGGGFYIHFVPFLQGMLYVGNTTLLGEEEIKLIQSLADAFSTAYARYEDFNKLEAAKKQVDQTLLDLKQAQEQLFQAEKMASLGQLTAGIAHEIQNPLNFVNNFSEANKELIDELSVELSKSNMQAAIAIAKDIRDNEEKIYHHGRRAESIVKSMLQHARASAGKKEPVSINKLAEEYLRLSYQGVGAKDKAFSVTIETHFDESISEIHANPQDISRVLLNLFNNAFYAIAAKKKLLNGTFNPIVSVTTKKDGSNLVIVVRDNGIGMSSDVAGKVFEPFFTTKPAGEGTGLGLSLSYDIITKGHGGHLSVYSKEGEGSEFLVKIPLQVEA